MCPFLFSLLPGVARCIASAFFSFLKALRATVKSTQNTKKKFVSDFVSDFDFFFFTFRLAIASSSFVFCLFLFLLLFFFSHDAAFLSSAW